MKIHNFFPKNPKRKEKALKFISEYVKINSSKIFYLNGGKKGLANFCDKKQNTILNTKKVNDIRYINKFFELVNETLPKNGLFIGKVEILSNRKRIIYKIYPPLISKIVYFFDYVFNRFLPKIIFIKKIYFLITRGKGRVISKAECFGRLYSCGFEIINEKNIGKNQYFIAKKIKAPFYDKNPTYGPLIFLKRIGKNEKIFNVYKFRTMHPFSEYLQEYIFDKNNLKSGGKIKNDFRISSEGKILRKFWIDEIPMFINVLKGDMKLVGVRPLSLHYFNLYDNDLKKLRTKYKPGLIPPFYAHLPKTFKDIMDSERKYLIEYSKSPFKTDLKYFWLSFKNIIFNNARSG